MYDHVLLLSGNHDLYNKNVVATALHEEIEKICLRLNKDNKLGHNIIYLQKKTIEIDGYIFLGCTLWSEIKNIKETGAFMPDYKFITEYKGEVKLPIKPATTNTWHKDHVLWMKTQLQELAKVTKKSYV